MNFLLLGELRKQIPNVSTSLSIINNYMRILYFCFFIYFRHDVGTKLLIRMIHCWSDPNQTNHNFALHVPSHSSHVN